MSIKQKYQTSINLFYQTYQAKVTKMSSKHYQQYKVEKVSKLYVEVSEFLPQEIIITLRWPQMADHQDTGFLSTSYVLNKNFFGVNFIQ